ncbi:MAG: hypothetical protein WC658_00610 [Candidatus Omnitrophota bacterium]
MSIIYEALKKVENLNAIKKPLDSPRLARHKTKTHLLFILIVASGFLAASILFNLLSHTPEKKIVAVPQVPPAILIPAAQEPLPAGQEPAVVERPKEEPPAAKFILNGIFFSQNEGYALINNQIVKSGDNVAGASVKRVDPNEVELESAGKVITLSFSGGTS